MKKNTSLSVLDGVDHHLASLEYSMAIQKRAAEIGFDWPHVQDIFTKLAEETAELQFEVDTNEAKEKITDELGDLFFCCVNLARHLQIDPDSALRFANEKFVARFRLVEQYANERDISLHDADLDALNLLWNEAKKELAKNQTPRV